MFLKEEYFGINYKKIRNFATKRNEKALRISVNITALSKPKNYFLPMGVRWWEGNYFE